MKLLVLLAAIGSILVGCGKDAASGTPSVVGTWTFSSSTLQETLVLRSDRTYSDAETGTDAHVPATITGTYSLPDNSTIVIDPGAVNSRTYTVAFPDSVHMTLTPQGTGSTETYTKQL